MYILNLNFVKFEIFVFNIFYDFVLYLFLVVIIINIKELIFFIVYSDKYFSCLILDVLCFSIRVMVFSWMKM